MRLQVVSCLTGVVVLLGLLGAQASAVSAPSLVLGQPFAFAPSFGPYATVAASGLGSDSTAWVVVLNDTTLVGADRGFAVIARAADGTTMRPDVVGGAANSLLNRPTLSVSGRAATVVWLTYAKLTVTVHALNCTLSGCAPAQVVASWPSSAPLSGEYTYPEPAVASVNGDAVVVFARFGVAHPQMMWAQTNGPRFGPAHSFGVNGNYDPAIVAEPDGRIFAAWLAGRRNEGSGDVSGLYPAGVSIKWSEWSAADGFGAVRTAPGGRGTTSAGELAAAATSSGVTLAWLQGGLVYSEEGTMNSSVWATREQAGRFSRPQRVAGSAADVSLAGGADVVALGFTRGTGFSPFGYSPAEVTTSIGHEPFSQPVELDGHAGPPLVSVDDRGDALATWFAHTSNTHELGSQELAIATPGGAFAAPTTLSLGTSDAVGADYYLGDEQPYYGGPASFATVGKQSLIVSTVLPPPTTPTSSATLFGTITTP